MLKRRFSVKQLARFETGPAYHGYPEIHMKATAAVQKRNVMKQLARGLEPGRRNGETRAIRKDDCAATKGGRHP